MKAFFENQRVDEVGIYAVKLQKVLVISMILHAASAAFFFTFSGLLVTLGIVALFMIGFHAAHKRNVRLLKAYYISNLCLIFFTILLSIAAVFFIQYYVSQSSSSEVDFMTVGKLNDTQSENTLDVVPVSGVDSSSDQSSDAPSDVPSDLPSFSPSFSYDTEVGYTNNYFILFAVASLAFGLVKFGLHIASIIMACRLARMIREKAVQNLAHPRKQISEPAVVPQAPMNGMFIPVPVQPNNFGYFPMYNMPPQQAMFYNPYLVNAQQQQAQV